METASSAESCLKICWNTNSIYKYIKSKKKKTRQNLVHSRHFQKAVFFIKKVSEKVFSF